MQAGEQAAAQCVVLIDDNLAVLGALKFALEMEGFAVVAFQSGAELLAQRSLPACAALVIDFRLPDMDGIALLSVLRGRQVNLPAILMTSHPSPALRAEAARAGMTLLEKPLLGNALIEAVRSSFAQCAPAPCPQG